MDRKNLDTKNLVTKNILQKIDQYLQGKISAEDFSYDFPVAYSLHAKILDKVNPPLSRLLETELIPLCRKYDPYDFYNIPGEKCVAEGEFKEQVLAIYAQANQLN